MRQAAGTTVGAIVATVSARPVFTTGAGRRGPRP